MLELLTEKEKDKMRHEYVLRRGVVILSALILVLVIGIVGFLPAYILSNVRENEASEWVRIINSLSLKKNEIEFQTQLLETKRRLTALSPKLDVDRPSNFIKKTLDQKISGVRVINLSWVKTNKKTDLSVSGVASNRQALVTFRDQLDSSGYFSGVTLPISDLAKDKNINFQIKFSQP